MEGPTVRRPARQRVVDAALSLFAEHGVGGTSLQMIADEIGVTKAAVYHQYPTKDEIVLAVAASELARVEAVVERAEAESSRSEARDIAVEGMVDLAIETRRTTGTILGDPVIAESFADDTAFRSVMHRLQVLLVGDAADAAARVRTAMLIAAVSGAATHPLAVDLDDDRLRNELRRLALALLGA